MSLQLAPTMGDVLGAATRPLAGMWISTGSPVAAEIVAGAGLDWVLIDMEHAANDLASVLSSLQVTAAYPVTTMVRVPANDTVYIKRVLDLGAQNILVPMVSTVDEAQQAAAAIFYPPRGVRGIGSALARSGRWNRIPGYLGSADQAVSLTVQIETVAGVRAASDIATVSGVDAVFVGPSDLSASMGLIGQQTHPDVKAAVIETIAAVKAAGKKVGVNAFDPEMAAEYVAAGADFIVVGADVTLLARGSESLAQRWCQ